MNELVVDRVRVGSWSQKGDLFEARVDVKVERPIGCATSYWTDRVQDLGERRVMEPRWLKVFSSSAAAAKTFLEVPPSRFKAELFLKRLAARVSERGTEVQMELERESDRAIALYFTEWITRRAQALRASEGLGGLKPGRPAPFIYAGQTRGTHRFDLERAQWRRYQLEAIVNLSIGTASAQIKRGEVSASGDEDIVAIFEEIDPRGIEHVVNLNVFPTSGDRAQLEVDAAARLPPVPDLVAIANELIKALERLEAKRKKRSLEREKGLYDDAKMRELLALLDANLPVHPERTANERIEAQLSGLVLNLDGTLQVRATDLDVTRTEVRVSARLPPLPAPMFARFRTRAGALDWVRERFDEEVGSANFDEAFLVEKLDEGLIDEVSALSAVWVRAATASERLEVQLSETLVISATGRSADAAELASALVESWRAIASARAGLS